MTESLIKEFTHNGKTIKIYPDGNPENPRELDNLGTMVYWHPKYNLGDEQKGFEDIVEISRKNNVIFLPLYLFDHGDLILKTSKFSSQFDAGHVGIIYIEKETAFKEFGWKKMTKIRMDRVKRNLDMEVKIFNQYLRGEIFGYVIEDKSEEDKDSCWGFYGMDYCIEQAKEAAGYEPPPPSNPYILKRNIIV